MERLYNEGTVQWCIRQCITEYWNWMLMEWQADQQWAFGEDADSEWSKNQAAKDCKNYHRAVEALWDEIRRDLK